MLSSPFTPDMTDSGFDVIGLSYFSGLSIVLQRESLALQGPKNKPFQAQMISLVTHRDNIFACLVQNQREWNHQSFNNGKVMSFPLDDVSELPRNISALLYMRSLSEEELGSYGMISTTSKYLALLTLPHENLPEDPKLHRCTPPCCWINGISWHKFILIGKWKTLAEIFLHGPSKAFRAALTATSISSSSPSETWQISLPVLQKSPLSHGYKSGRSEARFRDLKLMMQKCCL